jgi:hypothetical protein
MSALGAGSLVGLIVAGIGPRPPASRFGPFVLSIAAVIGLGLAGLALVPSTPAACLVALVAGAAMGYVNLTFITWAQQRIPKAVMGRVFSVILLGSIGLVPLSQVVAGALVQLSLDGTMIVSGVAMALLTLAAATRPAVRAMGLEPILADGPEA